VGGGGGAGAEFKGRAEDAFIIRGHFVGVLNHGNKGCCGADVFQGMAGNDPALPFGGGEFPPAGEGRAVGEVFRVVEQRGKFDEHGHVGGKQGRVDVGNNVIGMVQMHQAVADKFHVNGAVAVGKV